MEHFFRTELWLSFLDMLFPQSCLACGNSLPGRQGIAYCPACIREVRLLQEPFCITCGIPFDRGTGESHLCGICLGNAWHFRQARAVVCYEPPVTLAVKMFKYKASMHGLATFAALAQKYLQRQPLEQPDLIVPVPLHVKRLRQRGFNQALILSRKFFPRDRRIIEPRVLERHHWVRPQTGLRGSERRRNVRNAFRVCSPEKVKHRKVLLVDDVFTTGATVNECARVLVKSEAAWVDVFTFARATS